jgi:predicted nucleic acid-binding Zn ribbon protein
MPMDERYCTECRAAIPKGESVCPACGVYAGDVFDGKLPKQRRLRAWWWLALIVIAAAGAWMFAPWPLETRPPRKLPIVRPHVIKDQRDAMTTLRHFLTTSERNERCVALIAKEHDGAKYVIAAVDSCKHLKLGTFAVDAKTATVTKR